jgi:hypothetical protein
VGRREVSFSSQEIIIMARGKLRGIENHVKPLSSSLLLLFDLT